MLNVAMLSKWHVHADGYAKIVKNDPNAEITVVWDEDQERGSAWAKELGCDFEPCLTTLLARKDVDAVLCNAPTTAHCEILVEAANAGKHIFTEKALAPTVAECLKVKDAVEKNEVTFVISLPQRGKGTVQFAKKMIADGAFGKITYARYRDAHSGVSGNWLPKYWFEEKDAAGGAMMDLGCHPMYLLAYLCGTPKRISALFNAPLGSIVDENAVAIIEFENGSIGVAETSFDTYASPKTLEIYGTDGSFIAHGDDDVKFTSTKLNGIVKGFIKPDLPNAKPNPLNQFISACVNGSGTPDDLGIDDAIALTRLLENAYTANKSNQTVQF